MLNKEDKIAVWDNGIDKEINRAHYESFVLGDDTRTRELQEQIGTLFYGEVLNMIRNEYKKRSRVRSKTQDIIKDGNAVFLTLTFRNEVLANTSAETRRTYVRKFLKKNADVYVANVDYAPDTGREHYHALAFPKGRIDHTEWEKLCGWLSVRKVRNQDLDVTRTSRYMTKLSRHALKNAKGSRAPRLIYSRTARGESSKV